MINHKKVKNKKIENIKEELKIKKSNIGHQQCKHRGLEQGFIKPKIKHFFSITKNNVSNWQR